MRTECRSIEGELLIFLPHIDLKQSHMPNSPESKQGQEDRADGYIGQDGRPASKALMLRWVWRTSNCLRAMIVSADT